MTQQNHHCGLCERPAFSDQIQPFIYTCNRCFQFLQVNRFITITNILTKNCLLLTDSELTDINSLEDLNGQKLSSFQKIHQLLKDIKNYRQDLKDQQNNSYHLINSLQLSKAENIITIWKNITAEVNNIIQGSAQNILISLSNNSISSHKTKIQPSITRFSPNQQKFCKISQDINSLNPETVPSEQFSFSTELQTIQNQQIQNSKRLSIINPAHLSHNISKQNSIDYVSKIPLLQLNNKKVRKNKTSVVSSSLNSQQRFKTEVITTNNQIQWLIYNSDHDPQGFRDINTTRATTGRRMTAHPMTQCIKEALKFTTISNNTMSLIGIDLSKTAFDCYLNMTPWTNSLTSIKLVKVGLLDHQFNLLLCFAARNGNLKNILATNNHLTEQSLQMLLNFVKKIKQLQKIYLGKNSIKPLNGKQLVKQIKSYGIQCLYI